MFVGLDLALCGVGIGGVMTVSVAPHHTTTPHHISTLSQVPAVPASQRRTLSQSQGYPAPAASLLSAAVLLRRTRGSQPQLALIALVTLSHSRDISLQL